MTTSTGRRRQQEVAPQRRLPPIETLLAWKEEGLRHVDIVERVERETGTKLTPQAVSLALARAGKRPARVRYDDVLPWKVRAEHVDTYICEMLRAEGRRRRKGDTDLPPALLRKLESFLDRIHEAGAVVSYLAETALGYPDGFIYLTRDERIDAPDAIIREDPYAHENLPKRRKKA